MAGKEMMGKDQVEAIVKLWDAYFASTLKEFLTKAYAKDDLGTAIAAAKVAQLGKEAARVFAHVASSMCAGSETAVRACNEANANLLRAVDKRTSDILATLEVLDEAVLDTERAPDRNTN